MVVAKQPGDATQRAARIFSRFSSGRPYTKLPEQLRPRMRAAVVALESRRVRHPEGARHVDDARARLLRRRHHLQAGRHRQPHHHDVRARDRLRRRQILKHQVGRALQIRMRRRHVLARRDPWRPPGSPPPPDAAAACAAAPRPQTPKLRASATLALASPAIWRPRPPRQPSPSRTLNCQLPTAN